MDSKLLQDLETNFLRNPGDSIRIMKAPYGEPRILVNTSTKEVEGDTIESALMAAHALTVPTSEEAATGGAADDDAFDDE